MVALLDAVLEGGVPPALVDGGPDDDGGVIEVAHDGLGPLLLDAGGVLEVELVGVGHLAPDEVAEAVGPVQEQRVLDLLVLAAPIEPHALRQLDVRLDALPRRRRRQPRPRPVPLVQVQRLEQRLPVEPERPVPAAPLQAAEPRVRVHLVDDAAGAVA